MELTETDEVWAGGILPECWCANWTHFLALIFLAGGSQEERLRRSYCEFVSQCKQHKIRALGFIRCNFPGCFAAHLLQKTGMVSCKICRSSGNKGQIFSMWLGLHDVMLDLYTNFWYICFPLCFRNLRKHLVQPGKYPSLAQKHLNGAVGTSTIFTCSLKPNIPTNSSFLGGSGHGEMAQGCVSCSGTSSSWRWTCLVTWPATTHVLFTSRHLGPMMVMLRLRAAVFVNLVMMRDSLSKVGLVVPEQNLGQLKAANYLYHSALNSV